MKTNEVIASGPWIVAQIARIRMMEVEVGRLLNARKPSRSTLMQRVAELKAQVALLELSLG